MFVTWSLIGMWLSSISLVNIFSLIKWLWTFICFIHAWKIGLLAILILLELSYQFWVAFLMRNPNSLIKFYNHMDFFLPLVMYWYLIIIDEKATIGKSYVWPCDSWSSKLKCVFNNWFRNINIISPICIYKTFKFDFSNWSEHQPKINYTMKILKYLFNCFHVWFLWGGHIFANHPHYIKCIKSCVGWDKLVSSPFSKIDECSHVFHLCQLKIWCSLPLV